MQIIFCDLNQSLVGKVAKAIKYLPKEIDIKTICGDIFSLEGVIVSASNPQFTCSGGLDYLIAQKYPQEAKKAQITPGKMKRTKHVIWTITVDENLRSNRLLVAGALKFAMDHGKKNETLLISGLGCGIGGLQ